MSTALALYGTDRPDVPGERIAVGDVSFTLQGAALRHLRVGETEVIRCIAFLVRDRDWGTLEPELTEVSRQVGEALDLRLAATYRGDDAPLEVSLRIRCDGAGLRYSAEGRAVGDFETNRAGFTVLHSAGLAGCPVDVRHSDGNIERSAFPVLIEPWQPFMDIVSLRHRSEGWR